VTLVDATAGVILLSLVTYALLAGADFGGGVWDLFASGPRRERQREAIAHAIGPIWEANHVWMIVAVVVLFTAFPPAFALVMTALHVPVSLMLVGIVLRGTAFVFRKVDPTGGGTERRWQVVFAVSSLLTPVMLGVVLGTISTPVLGYEGGIYTGGFFAPWLRPFPWLVGLLATALFAFLAAVYLAVEAEADADLAADFRMRGLWAGAAVALGAGACAALLPTAAPELAAHLFGTAAGRVIVGAAALALAGALLALSRGADRTGRMLAAATTLLILVGWGTGQYPWLVAGALTAEEAAAPRVTLVLVAWILGIGSLILVPAFVYLYAIFKGATLFPWMRGGR
jgi:cytochrome d ubiquinol oxidase subunit II